jgi:hypothetical protein
VIEKFLHESDQVDETSLLQSFTAWVRSEVQPHYDASKSGNGKK